MAAITRKQYKGAAAQTTITNALGVGDTSITIAATTGWGDGASAYYVVISPGTSSEEKCLATRSGSTLTLTRAQDDTTAQSHASGATIYPVFTADEADEANFVASRWTTKGDLVTFNGTDVARQGVGANGTFLIADSGQTNGVAWSEQSLGYRNVVINGAMQVAQRGTSVASITATGYNTVDRWQASIGTMGTWTQSVENDAPTGSGLRKSLKMLCTTADAAPAAGDTLGIVQGLEGQNVQQFLKGTASAKQFAMSFWVKSNVTGTYIAELVDIDNTRSVSASYTISASGTWEKKTIIFPADTTGAFDNDNALSLNVRWWLGAGTNFTSGTLATTWASTTNANRAVGQTNLAAATNNYWQITGVQLEAGSVATPFEFEDYGTTLAKCQRYYQRIQPNGTSKAFGPIGRIFSTTEGQFSIPYTVPMRAAPSALEQSGTATDYRISHGGISTQCSAVPTHGASTTELFGVVNTTVASGLTTGQAALLTTDTGSSAGFLAWSAEL